MRDLPKLTVKGSTQSNLEILEERMINPMVTSIHTLNMDPYIAIRHIGGGRVSPFDGRAFYLDSKYDWVLGKDIDDSTILVPVRKVPLSLEKEN